MITKTMNSRVKKIEACFDSVEKIVSLQDALTRAMANISINLQWAIGRLEQNQLIDPAVTSKSGLLDFEPVSMPLKDGLIKVDNDDIEYINKQYTDALWETMQILLPHYKSQQ